MIPCEECITLAICNSIYLEYHRLEGVAITKLKRKCSIMNSFLENKHNPFCEGEASAHEVNSHAVIHFFKRKNHGYLVMEQRRLNREWKNSPV